MSRVRSLNLAVLLVITACLLVSVVPAFAEETPADTSVEIENTAEVAEDTSYAGAYAVVATTNTGKQVNTNVVVYDVGEGRIQLQANVMGFPVTTGGEGVWNSDRTEVTVPVSVYIISVAEGSGTVTLTRSGAGWDFYGSGSGSVFTSSGSATAVGSKPADYTTTPEQEAEAAGISETAQSLDESTQPLQPDTQPEIVTDDEIAAMATILFLAFLWLILDWFLGFGLI